MKAREIVHRRGSWAGTTAFLLGNGPSVREHNLALLEGRHLIGMNASTLLEKEYGFTSQYYVVSDARFLTHPEKRALATTALEGGTVRVLREDLLPLDDKKFVGRTYYVPSLGKNGFSDDLARGFYFGCTTSMLALQLAAYLGARRIVLLGNDFRYSSSQPRFYKEEVPQAHDPFLSVQIWNVRNAVVALEARQVEVVICTKSSTLVPYVPFLDFSVALSSLGK